ncbi:MFS transporter [Aquirhabdus sp.]|uniref:MFS transporter n=1 Tax=Aquirhabdus sp. TaxID=2824160 RepID=UPI00396CD5F3
MNAGSTLSSQAKSNILLAIIVASYLMIVVDISIIITGLPKIKAGLGFTTAELSWVQNAYTLAFGGLLLLGARAGDILGRKRMYIVGTAVFTLASLAIGVAQSPAWLLVFRAIQGVGAAVLAPSTLALLSTNFAEGPERTRALSLYAAAAGLGAILGLVLGGLVADLISWRVGFFINLPIGIALITGARRYFTETPREAGHFDLIGAISSTVGMVALVYGIVRSADVGWGAQETVVSLITGIVLIAVFIAVESRAEQPILPLRLFANKIRSSAYVARMLFMGGMVGFWFFSTQYLQGVLGFTPLQAGLAFLPVSLPNLISAVMVPRLTRTLGNGGLIVAGLVVAIVGLLWLGQATANTPYLTGVALPMLFIGFGQGAVLAPLTVEAVAEVAPEDTGAASGMVNVAHQLGGSLGLGVLVVVFTAAKPADLHSVEALAHQITTSINGSACMLALAAIIALTLIVPKRARVTTAAEIAAKEPEVLLRTR